MLLKYYICINCLNQLHIIGINDVTSMFIKVGGDAIQFIGYIAEYITINVFIEGFHLFPFFISPH